MAISAARDQSVRLPLLSWVIGGTLLVVAR
jgi:hypothetical protein